MYMFSLLLVTLSTLMLTSVWALFLTNVNISFMQETQITSSAQTCSCHSVRFFLARGWLLMKEIVVDVPSWVVLGNHSECCKGMDVCKDYPYKALAFFFLFFFFSMLKSLFIHGTLPTHWPLTFSTPPFSSFQDLTQSSKSNNVFRIIDTLIVLNNIIT